MRRSVVDPIVRLGLSAGAAVFILLLAGFGSGLVSQDPTPGEVSLYGVAPSTQQPESAVPAGSAVFAISVVDFADGTVEIVNVGGQDGTLDGYWLCNFPGYVPISGAVPAGGSIALPFELSASGGEVGLYSSNDFTSAQAIGSYVEWGDSTHQRSSVAVAAAIWDGVPLAAGATRLNATTDEPSGSTDWSTE